MSAVKVFFDGFRAIRGMCLALPHWGTMKPVPRLAVISFAAAASFACLARAQMPVTKVVVAEAQVREARPTVTLVGTVVPVRRSRVGTEMAGLVKEMPVREGDFVAAGGILCKLDDRVQVLERLAQAARLASLKAFHDELLAGTRAEELRRLKATLDASVADYQRWKFEMARIEKLFANSDSNTKEYRDTQAELIAAEHRHIAAEAAYNLAVEGPRKEAVARAAHDVAEQQAIADRAARDLVKMVIRAPFAGYIVDRRVEVGEWVVVGGAVVEMVDLSSVLVRVDVPESALPYLAVADAARVTIDALQRSDASVSEFASVSSFDGKIKHIIRQADENARTFPVEIEIDNHDGLLAGGMFARVTLSAGATVEAVAVPKDAIVERDGTAYVALVIPGRGGGMAGILQPVTVGIAIDDWITITSANLRPGSQVITRGTERIPPFPTPIEIVDEHGTPVAMPGPATDETPHRPGESRRSEGT